jgi:ribosome recycling factor
MIDNINADCNDNMSKTIHSLDAELTKLRTGRAHPSLLSHLMVDYYGHPTPLSQVANISVESARMLCVVPYEKAMVLPVEKAIMKSSLGLNPVTAGQNIRIPLPPLTEERRVELTKLVGAAAENARISIRSVRRDANQKVKQMEKDKLISEDDQRQSEVKIQKLTDEFITKVDAICDNKVSELMKI